MPEHRNQATAGIGITNRDIITKAHPFAKATAGKRKRETTKNSLRQDSQDRTDRIGEHE